MILKFDVVVKSYAVNEFSLFERLRDALFEWQTKEVSVKSVSILPARSQKKRNGEPSTNNGMAAKRKKFSIKSAQMPRCCMECPIKKDTRCEFGWGGCGCKDKLARHFAMP